jgi:hypothetical protein
VTVHGLLENADVVTALVGSSPQRRLEAVFDQLADAAQERLDIAYLAELARVA